MRSSRLARLAATLAAALALSLAPPAAPASAQDSIPAATAVAQSPAGVPAQDPPRTLRAYWHVFTAFTLAWLFLFGYTLSLGRRFRRLEQDVDSLRNS